MTIVNFPQEWWGITEERDEEEQQKKLQKLRTDVLESKDAVQEKAIKERVVHRKLWRSLYKKIKDFVV